MLHDIGEPFGAIAAGELLTDSVKVLCEVPPCAWVDETNAG
jgi:hypothetical protein